MTSESTINLFWFRINVYMNRYLELTYFVTIALYVSESLFYLWQLKNPLCCKNIISESRNSLSLSLSLSFFLSLSSLSPSESRVDLTKVSHILPTKSAAPLSLSLLEGEWTVIMHCNPPARRDGGGGAGGFCNHSLPLSPSLSPLLLNQPTPKTGYVAIQPTIHDLSIYPPPYFDRISQLILLQRLGLVLAQNWLNTQTPDCNLSTKITFLPKYHLKSELFDPQYVGKAAHQGSSPQSGALSVRSF